MNTAISARLGRSKQEKWVPSGRSRSRRKVPAAGSARCESWLDSRRDYFSCTRFEPDFDLAFPPAIHPPSHCIMSVRSAWRALHYSAKRRVVQPTTPYRCFSCTRQAGDQAKSDQERMTHFGFTNVPESEKESRGRSQSFCLALASLTNLFHWGALELCAGRTICGHPNMANVFLVFFFPLYSWRCL